MNHFHLDNAMRLQHLFQLEFHDRASQQSSKQLARHDLRRELTIQLHLGLVISALR
jgi:hypothetical protein